MAEPTIVRNVNNIPGSQNGSAGTRSREAAFAADYKGAMANLKKKGGLGSPAKSGTGKRGKQ